MKQIITMSCLAACLAFAAGGAEPKAQESKSTPNKPAFNDSGAITFGEKSIALRNGHLFYSANGKTLIDMYPYWSSPNIAYGEAGLGDAFSEHAVNVDTQEFHALATIKNAGGARYEIKVKVLEDGLINYHIKFLSMGDLTSKTLQVRFPGHVLEGATIMDEDTKFVADNKFTGEDKSFYLATGISPEFFAGDPDKSIRFTLIKYNEKERYGISDCRGDSSNPRFEYRPQFNKDDEFECNMDIRKISATKAAALGSQTISEFDPYQFERYNRAALPNYAAARNLVQNPSFEEGLHGWFAVGDSRAEGEHGKESLVIDDSTAFDGKKSLRFELRPSLDPKKATTIGMVAPYAFQMKIGKKYTVSFYAKSEQPGLKLGCIAISKDWGKWMASPNFMVTKEWKRFASTFTATDSLTTLYFGVFGWDNDTWYAVKDAKVHLWMDAVQFEEGDAATPFTVKPLSFSMERTDPMQWVSGKKSLLLDVMNNTDEAKQADVTVTLADINKNELLKKTFTDVEVPPRLSAPLKIDPGGTMDYIGEYGVRVDVTGADHYHDYDFFKVAVIEPFTAQRLAATKNRGIFGQGGIPSGGDLMKNIRLMSQLGLGAVESGDMLPVSKEVYDTITANGIIYFNGMFGDNNIINFNPETPFLWKFLEQTDLEGDYMKTVYARMPEFFRKYSYIKNWKYVNEPDIKWNDEAGIGNSKTHARLMERFHAIIKKEIPDCRLISSDAASLSEGSLQWYDAMLAEGAAKYFDVFAIHPYRDRPERPSLEHDTELTIDLLKKYKLDKCDIWYTEGGGFGSYTLPALNITTTGLSGGEIRVSEFTSDLLDRLGVAVHLRNLLVNLKYSDRVKMFINWTVGQCIQPLRSLPTEVGVGYNAYANLLGNSKFVRDFNYAESIKAFLFDDGKGNAVLAMWDFDETLERHEREPYRFRLDQAATGARVTDSFGRPLKTEEKEGALAFDVDYMPVLVMSKDMKSLTRALEKSRILYSEGEAITYNVTLADPSNMLFIFNNRNSKAFDGSLQLALNGKSSTATLAIPPLGEQRVSVPLDGIVDLSKARFTVKMSGAINTAEKKLKDIAGQYNFIVCNRRTSPITIDGDLADWKGYKAGEIGLEKSDVINYKENAWSGPDDLSAKFMTAWDEEGLYLAVEVKDDVFHQTGKGGDTWSGDSLQMFIDSYRDGRQTSLNMADDYAYTMAKTPEGDQAYRAFTPDKQIAWLDNGVVEKNVELKIKRDEARKITVYEMRFPRKYIFPVALKKNNVIGFGLMVNDADDATNRKSAITTCNGKEGWMQPYNLSFLIFE